MSLHEKLGTILRTDRVEPSSQKTATICAQDLTKTFGSRTCVDKLTFSAFAGELYALLGENGAGKTTTVNMLTTLLRPTSGEFYICGHSGIKKPEKAKALFGVVSQDVAIYQELTAYENLAFVANLYGIPKTIAASRIELLLKRADLAGRASDLAGEFSLGMQRKLTIAMAILHEPKVLFMDEPTVGLDPASRQQIWLQLQELKKQGVTILLTTHHLEEAELLADRVGIIKQGRLILEGTIDELRRSIESICTVSVTLGAFGGWDVEAKCSALATLLNTRVEYDSLRNAVKVYQPVNSSLTDCLKVVISWLEQEKIPISRVNSSEPSLEEVFLKVATDHVYDRISTGQGTR